MLRLNYYGEHYDERGRIDGVDGGAPTKLLSSTVFVDAELAFEFSDEMRFTLGASNLFDAYIDVIDAPYANRLNVGLLRAPHGGQLRRRILVSQGILSLVGTAKGRTRRAVRGRTSSGSRETGGRSGLGVPQLGAG